MTPPTSSSAGSPLSPEFFFKGREVVRYPWPYKTPEDAVRDIFQKLSAISNLSPIKLRIIIAEVVANAMTNQADSTLLDFLNAAHKIYEVVNETSRSEMTDEITTNPGESFLAFSLRREQHRIATGESQIVPLSEMEDFGREMDQALERARDLNPNPK
jgi:hypothetical protein